MSRDPKTGITRRTFVAGSAAAAVGVAAGVEAGAAPAPGAFPGAPPFAVDDTTECELLICVRDVPTSRWRDGDLIQAFSAEDAIRVHAEVIANGRGEYRGDALPELRALFDRITNNRRDQPGRDDLLLWWDRAFALTGLDIQDHTRFPFTELEHRKFLVLPLDADITPARRQVWEDTDGTKQWKLSVDWRAAIVAPGLATAAAVLDRTAHVALDRALPLSIVSVEPVLIPNDQEL